MFFSTADAAIPKVRWRRSKMNHWFSYDTVYSDLNVISAIWFDLRQERILKNMYLLFPKIILTLLKNLNLYGDGLIHIKGIRSPVPPLSHGDRKVIEDISKAEALFSVY